MSSQTSLVAKQFRLQTWAAQIQDCQNRWMIIKDRFEEQLKILNKYRKLKITHSATTGCFIVA